MPYLEAPDCTCGHCSIKCPTLVIGTDTARCGRSVVESWQETIPGAELAILSIDGYHAAGTDPDRTARVTLDFIARHSSPR